MDEDKVAVDEARRAAQHASVKSRIAGDVSAEIIGQVHTATPEQPDRVGQVAAEFRSRALDETLASEHDVARSRNAARTSRFIDYGFYLRTRGSMACSAWPLTARPQSDPCSSEETPC